ncbi:MAG: Proteasome subunit alpha [Candidatus Nitrospira kreftii]|uniref:Proteasome subunit alpha n=1 Tax=Candidatus Nitrospira kreftii TaxID=2652173 RepID=A0A7S8FHH0_9BACT|nr:MAG: Proteasome subunit alpha [Candidatus Nitrospira kreftii]
MGMQSDFYQLLREQGYVFGLPGQAARGQELTMATTILAFKYRDGVLVAGDRRATAGNMVMYDRTDKVLEIDRHSVMAIAGVPATAYEMARILEHSFKYYRRTQLQELSFEGKLRALSKLLKDNVPAALAGTGAVAPIFAGYDFDQEAAKIYFYDILGAEFEGVDYAVSGSGSPTIRGIMHYLNTWGEQPLSVIPEEQATVQALRLLTSAAEFDSATGGVNRDAGLYPVIKFITASGVRTMPDAQLKPLFESKVSRHV